MVRFDFGALLEGRMWSLIPIMVYISLIIGGRGFDVKTTYGKSCAPNGLGSLILIMTYISLIIGSTL